MKNTLSLFVCAISFFAGSQAFSDYGHPGGPGHGVCGQDMKKLCGDVKKDDHEGMMKCMKEHEANLSDSCKSERTKMMAEMDAAMAACKPDMNTLCKDVAKDNHRAMHECMTKNEAKLSDACKAEHAKMKKSHHDHEAHGDDQSSK